jgi:hypothetical protein
MFVHAEAPADACDGPVSGFAGADEDEEVLDVRYGRASAFL